MPDVYATRWFSEPLFTESNDASSRDSSRVCESQLIFSHRLAEHLKQCCPQNSERRLRPPADEFFFFFFLNGSRKIESSREGAVFSGQMRRGLGGSHVVA